MALPNYNRILFISDTDNIADTPASASALNSYLTDKGFDGVYLSNGDFSTNASNINTLIGTINMNLVGAIGGSSASAATVVSYNATQANDIDTFVMYNDFWNIGDDVVNWLDEFDGVGGISSSFWVTNYQNTSSTDIRTSGYTEVEVAERQIRLLLQSSGVGILISAFERGDPRYFTAANDKTDTNIFYKMDILAEAVRKSKGSAGTIVNTSPIILDPTFNNTDKWETFDYNLPVTPWGTGTETVSINDNKIIITSTGAGSHKIMIGEKSGSMIEYGLPAFSYPSFEGPCIVNLEFTTGQWDNTNPLSYVYINIDNGIEEPIGYTTPGKAIGSFGLPIQPNTTYTFSGSIPTGIIGGVQNNTGNPLYPTNPKPNGHTWTIHLRGTSPGDVHELTSFRVTASPAAQNTKLPIHLFIHSGQVEFGSSQNYSGYSLQSAGTFDAFEKKLLKSIVDRMTKFQKEHLDIKGFVYYDYDYVKSALP